MKLACSIPLGTSQGMVLIVFFSFHLFEVMLLRGLVVVVVVVVAAVAIV